MVPTIAQNAISLQWMQPTLLEESDEKNDEYNCTICVTNVLRIEMI
jgi:hypothetical protein